MALSIGLYQNNLVKLNIHIINKIIEILKAFNIMNVIGITRSAVLLFVLQGFKGFDIAFCECNAQFVIQITNRFFNIGYEAFKGQLNLVFGVDKVIA